MSTFPKPIDMNWLLKAEDSLPCRANPSAAASRAYFDCSYLRTLTNAFTNHSQFIRSNTAGIFTVATACDHFCAFLMTLPTINFYRVLLIVCQCADRGTSSSSSFTLLMLRQIESHRCPSFRPRALDGVASRGLLLIPLLFFFFNFVILFWLFYLFGLKCLNPTEACLLLLWIGTQKQRSIDTLRYKCDPGSDPNTRDFNSKPHSKTAL